jgi:hypothetical protein
MDRVCVIGAGSSGLASCQVLHARGIGFDCFERGSAVGGNWRYDNDNGMSSAYRSLHAKSSKRSLQYATFPMPDGYPNYPGHALITKYLDDFVDHFGFRDSIHFRTQVLMAAPAAGGGWDVTVRRHDTGTERTERYGALLVANGHHWDPRYPEPAFPGAAAFTGTQMHSHDYRTPEPFAGQRVLVLGVGNSACDIASECSAERVDVVIYCTGYKISFPFLDETLIGADDNQIPLYRRIVPPGAHGLYFIGLVQPIGSIMPVAEIQSEWVADLLQGRAALPPARQMNREIARYRSVTARRYGRCARTTIQVDFLAYLREIRKARRCRTGAIWAP